MNEPPDLLGAATPATEPRKHAPRAIINRLLEGARELEGDAIANLVKRNPDATSAAHWAMDCARSLAFAAKWLEEGK